MKEGSVAPTLRGKVRLLRRTAPVHVKRSSINVLCERLARYRSHQIRLDQFSLIGWIRLGQFSSLPSSQYELLASTETVGTPSIDAVVLPQISVSPITDYSIKFQAGWYLGPVGTLELLILSVGRLILYVGWYFMSVGTLGLLIPPLYLLQALGRSIFLDGGPGR